MIKQKRGSAWIWILIILFLVAVGVGIYFWLGGSVGDWGTLDSIPQPPALPS